MQKTIFLFLISFLTFSCEVQSPKEKSADSDNLETATEADLSKIGRTNYAVIWNWTTTNTQLVSDNTPIISQELNDLWKDDIVENAYYDADSPIDKLGYFPNIAFFLKAHSESQAKSILDKLTIVQKRIASYQLHPVGQLWLDRKTDVINKKGITNSYVAIWTTIKSPLSGANADVILKEQNDKILELWNQGLLENVYLDIEGTYKSNNKTDFVFFVNVKSKEEAEGICNSLPFVKKNIATYEMLQAGVFWMGKYESQ